MTARGASNGEGGQGWQGSRAELLVSLGLIIVTAGAVYGYAGAGAAVLSLVGWAVLLLILLRTMVPATTARAAHEQQWRTGARTSFTGFWRKRRMVADAAASMGAYDAELRPTLQHLLAARLAERHGISLYADPDAARRLLLGDSRDDRLWYWLDPQRPGSSAGGAHRGGGARADQSGIPPRTLAAIIDRLERL